MKFSVINPNNLKVSLLITPKLFLNDIIDLDNKLYPNEFHIKKAIEWLFFAQKVTKDGGVSHGFDLFSGWLPSYSETSGYLIPTFFDYSYFIFWLPQS